MMLRLITAVAFLWLSGTASAAAPEACRTLTATGNSEYPPYLWREGKEDRLLGANRIIMDELGRRLGITIQLQDVGSWARAQELAKTGDIDLIAGAFYTVPRTHYMDYIQPAFLDTTSIVWRKKGSSLPYAVKEDLKGRSVTTVINNSFGQEFDEFASQHLKLNYVTSLQQGFKMLAHGRTDFVLYEKNPGIAYAKLWGMSEAIDMMDNPISSEGLYLTISQRSVCNSEALRIQLAQTVAEMMAEGFMAEALQRGLDDWARFEHP